MVFVQKVLAPGPGTRGNKRKRVFRWQEDFKLHLRLLGKGHEPESKRGLRGAVWWVI